MSEGIRVKGKSQTVNLEFYTQEKINFKNEDKNIFRHTKAEFIASCHTEQDMLKEILQVEGK